MASVSTYLNFNGNTEEAFEFYKSVFGGEYEGEVGRMKDVPDQPPLSEEAGNMIMHICLPILNGHRLMGTDITEKTGFNLVQGNNVYINLEPDSKEEADMLFSALSDGGKVETPMQVMFWGDYYGSFSDKFGVRWMINYAMN